MILVHIHMFSRLLIVVLFLVQKVDYSTLVPAVICVILIRFDTLQFLLVPSSYKQYHPRYIHNHRSIIVRRLCLDVCLLFLSNTSYSVVRISISDQNTAALRSGEYFSRTGSLCNTHSVAMVDRVVFGISFITLVYADFY